MRLRKRILIIGIVVLLLLVLVGGMFLQGTDTAVGRCVVGTNGETLWINESGIPTIMNGMIPGMFASLKTGDKIFLLHSRQMAMSYPGQVGVYFCLKLENGSVEDLPEQALESLRKMGYPF